MFREFVSSLFRPHMKIQPVALDAFDQKHYRFRHNAMPRPALLTSRRVFYSPTGFVAKSFSPQSWHEHECTLGA
jgi:hypothetical protein